MTLPELKNLIMSKQSISELIIFKCEDEDFIPSQYIKEICNYTNSQLVTINDLQEYPTNQHNAFEEEDINYIYKYVCEDQLNELEENYKAFNNLFIICTKISKDLTSKFKDNIVEIPKLTEWQLKDYVPVVCPGLSEDQASWLAKGCNSSAYRLVNELNKLLPFPASTRKDIFNSFVQEGIFNTDISINTFDLISAIQTKDLNRVREILPKIDVSSMGLVSLLYSSFRNIIKVWLTKYPTENNTGLTSKQIWAINKLPKNYSKDQLLKIFDILTSIDFKLKNGDIQEKLISDYVITSILTV